MQFKYEILGKVGCVAPDYKADTNITESKFVSAGKMIDDQPRIDKYKKLIHIRSVDRDDPRKFKVPDQLGLPKNEY